MSPGYIVSLVLAGLSLAGMFIGFFVLLFVGLFGGIGETDRFGRVPVPGAAALELPAGRVSVFYEEGTSSRPDPPGGLDYTVRPAGGGPALETEGRGTFNERVSEGGSSRVKYDRVDVPAAGSYVVGTRVSGRTGPEPALTFGEALGRSAFEHVPKVLWGVVVLGIAAAIALGTLLLSRLRGSDESVELPREQ